MAEYNVLFTMAHIILLLFLSFTFVNMQISNKRLCADKECKVVISQVKALGRHIGDHPLLLTFGTDDVISVTSKSAGSNLHLWGGEVDGHRGYFDKNFVQEIKVFVQSPEHEVDTEGDIFERLGKPPPSVDDTNRRKKNNLDSDDDAGASEDKKEDAHKDDSALPVVDNDENRDVKEKEKSNIVEDKKDDKKEDVMKKDEYVDDLLNLAATLDQDSKLNDENVNKEDSDDDDEEKINNEEYLEEDFWDIDDNIDGGDDSYKWERDRFDTAGFFTPVIDALKELNNFLKNKLFSGSESKAEAVETPSEKEPDSLRVKPEAPEVVKEHGHEETNNVEKQKQSHEDVSSKDVDKSDRGESDKDDDPSHKSKSVSNEDTGEGNQVESEDDEKENSSKEETIEDGRVDSEADDPTEIDESPPDEFGINEMETVKNERLKEAAESNGKEEVKTAEEKISVKEVAHFEIEDDAGHDDVADKTSDHDQELKTEHSSESDKSHDSKGTYERNGTESSGEEALSKDEINKDSSADANISHDLKKDSKSSEAKNIGEGENAKDEAGDKASSVDDKSVDKTHLDKVSAAVQKADSSEVKLDTPLDASSPELSQKVDPIALQKSKLESDVEKSQKVASVEPDHSSKESATLSDKDEGKSEKEGSESKNPIADHMDQGGDKLTGAGFLHSSRAQLEDSDLPRETPKLNINPTSAFISDSYPSQLDIESSKIDDHKLDATGDNSNKKVNETEGFETITEGGSTIVLNKEGEVVTAILPEGHVSQTSDVVALTSSDDVKNALLTNSEQVNPTAVENTLKPSQSAEELIKVDIDALHSLGKDLNDSSRNSKIQLENSDKLLDSNVDNEAYQSVDFNSRKVLSVDHSPAVSQQQQQQQPASNSQEQPSEEKKQQEPDSVVPTVSPPLKPNSEMSSTASLTPAESPDTTSHDDNKESTAVNGQSGASYTGEQLKQEALPDRQEQPDGAPQVSDPQEATIKAPNEIPPSENTVESSVTPEDTSATTEDYGADSVYHSRKINDQDLLNEEEQKFTEPSQGFFKKIVTAFEGQTKDLLGKLPPSVHSLLESFGLLPNMRLLVVTFAVAMLISMSFISCCFSGGSNKKLQRHMLVKFDELEKKRQIDIKERQNMEDEIKSKEDQNLQLKGQIEKLNEESKKNKSELQTSQLHNETLKKQMTSLRSEVEHLKENASSKQGEVKQQSKKTKDLEKQIKRLEERERILEQTAQKLTSDLKHKEEEVVLLTSKVAGFTDLVGHLQTSKDQLLAEADDWKEKVSDLKERLEQREEEFKQMQETIMFKENELEVLKDCFLQLKSFEENEEGEEDAENVSARVQEKIASMMDVSKMNACLRSLEEEKNSLGNKLQIEMEARRELEEQLESSRRSLETSMADKMKAERQYQEAQTKFNVLSSYFKEKEMQLQRELGEHEALKKQNQNKLVSADETTKSAQQELDLIRTQSESLKRELASSERDFRSQIAANEKKAHENWLAARAAERELKEARHEAGVLRQKLTDIERRQFMGPGGLIRPLPTRIPPSGIMNGPPPPGMERSPSRGSMPPIPPPHMRDEDFLAASRGDRGPPPFPMDMRRGPMPPPGMRLPLDARSPPPRMPPFGSSHSPPLRMPPPGMMDGRSPPPYDRRLPPHHMSDRRSPPFRLPPSDMLPPPPLRGGPPLPPHYLVRGGAGSPTMGPDSPHLDGRYPLPHYGRNPPPHPSDRPSPKQSKQMSPQQSQV